MDIKAHKWRVLAGLVVFSVAFGYLEAAVVAYLRSIYTPVRLQFYPGSLSAEVFPLLSLDQLRTLGPAHVMRLKIELAREFATLMMLAGVAITVGRNVREGVAAFLICFGIWDITFYLWLKVLLAWPASLLTWDILFLLPVPWVGPVLAPVLVSVSMISAGVLLFWREQGRRPVEIKAVHWIGILFGAVLIFAAFIADFRNTAGGGYPKAFHWGLFLAGEACACLAFIGALQQTGSGLGRAVEVRPESA